MKSILYLSFYFYFLGDLALFYLEGFLSDLLIEDWVFLGGGLLEEYLVFLVLFIEIINKEKLG